MSSMVYSKEDGPSAEDCEQGSKGHVGRELWGVRGPEYGLQFREHQLWVSTSYPNRFLTPQGDVWLEKD